MDCPNQITIEGNIYVRQTNDQTAPYKVGQKYLIRTVTLHYTGRLVAVYPCELVLSEAAWIADTGRYNAALVNGTLDEVEPIVGDVVVGRGAVVDAVEWKHELPKTVK
jgi:hypothetical protein